MKLFRSHAGRPSVSMHALRRRLETLEDRTVPATISIADATAIEGSSALKFIDRFVAEGSGGLIHPHGLLFGPDANQDGALDLWVASTTSDAILRYDGRTGAFIDTFVTPGSGGLNAPFDLAFGLDGNLYVSSVLTNQVLQYNGSSGAFLGVVASGLSTPQGLMFGPDGSLYIANQFANEVLRYQNGSLSTFVTAGSGGLVRSRETEFGPDGNGDGVPDLYVSSASPGSGRVLRYDGLTGAYIDAFATPPAGVPGSLPGRGIAWHQFGTDGYLYTSARTTTDGFNTSIVRYNAVTGAFVDTFDLGRDGHSFILGPDGLVYDSSNSGDNFSFVERFGHTSLAVFTVTLDAPSPTPVTVQYTTGNGTALAGSDFTATNGTLTFAPGQTSRTILVRTLDDAFYEGNETFVVNLSNPVGATISDGQGVGTIADNEPVPSVTLTIADGAAIEGDHSAHYRGAFVHDSAGGRFNTLTFGPDGKLYTSPGLGAAAGAIHRYDSTTGEFLDTFVPQGEIAGVRDILFRDGFMFVASINSNQVLRYNANTGAFVDVFVAAGNGGIAAPDGMAFGPDANSDGVPELYVTGWTSHNVVRYDGATGQPLGTFITSGSGGLSFPFAFAFDSTNAFIYVTSAGTNQILKYSAQTGAYVGVAAATGLNYPRDVVFGPDGLMYVASGNNDRVLRFTAAGAYVDDFVPAGAGGLDNPRTLVFGPDGDLYVAATPLQQILRFGTESEVVFTVSLSNAATLPVSVNFATANGTAVGGSDFTTTNGTVTFAPGQTTRTILVRTLDDAISEGPETFTVNLTNATGAAISDAQAVGTIVDDEPSAPQVNSTTVNGGATQRSRVTSLSVTFNAQVTFAGPVANAFTLTRNGGGSVSFTASAGIINGVTVVTLNNFSGPETQSGSLRDGNYTLTAQASQISANGQQMASNYTFNFFRFYGDMNGDRRVDISDFGFFSLAYLNPLNYNAALDFNNDGRIDIADFGQFSVRFFTTLP